MLRREWEPIQQFKEYQEHEAPFDKHVRRRPSADPTDDHHGLLGS